jgi:hypothetical protein
MKKIFTVTFIMYFVLVGMYVFFEPELLQAAEDAEDVAISLTVNSEITLACDDTAALTGTVNGITGGSAVGSFSCTVVTPNAAGYEVKVKEGGKLLTGAGGANKQFDDYSPVSGADYAWVVPGAAAEIFGFSLDADTTSGSQLYKNNGAACNQAAGSVTDDHCWNGFGLADKTVASKASASTNDTVKLNLKAEADDTNALTPGDYANTVTVTATSL